MKTKEIYSTPVIEVIEVMMEDIIANSPQSSFNIDENAHDGGDAGARRRTFWD